MQKVASVPMPMHTGSGLNSIITDSKAMLTIRQIQLMMSIHFIVYNFSCYYSESYFNYWANIKQVIENELINSSRNNY